MSWRPNYPLFETLPLTVDSPTFTLSKPKFQLYFQNQMKDKRSFKMSRYYQFFHRCLYKSIYGNF